MSSIGPSASADEPAPEGRWSGLLSRTKPAGFHADAADILLSLLCLFLGPLVYAASLGTVAAMLVLTSATLVASRHAGAPVMAKSIGALAAVAPLLVWMLASALWSPDGAASVDVALRVSALFAAGILLVASFGLRPLERLRLPLIATALGFSAAGAVVAVDLVLGGHLALFLHGPRLDDIDPALAYGRAATLHAILLPPILVGLRRLGARRLAAACALFSMVAILESSSLSAKTALAASLVTFAAVCALPQLRWAGLVLSGFAALALPLIFPLSLNVATTCWLADHKPSALHRLEIWSFVAEHIAQRPIAGWGLDAARRVPGGTAPVIIRHCDAAEHPDGIALTSQSLPLHPHNAVLQVWLELGGIGVALGLGPLILSIWRAFGNPAWRARSIQAMIAGTATAALSVALVSFGIWQEWFVSGLFIAAAFAVLAARLAAAPAREAMTSPARRGLG